MPTTLRDVLAFVRTANLDDRQQISAALNERVREAIADAKEEFAIGDRVEFNPGKRGQPSVVRGKLVEKRQKTFIIQPDDGGQRWRVAATAVRKSF
jgi:hypothetical protein